MPKRTWILFGLLLILGASLRFHALDRQSLWDDEMSTRKDVYLPVNIWPAAFRTYEMHPPLYFLQLKGWDAAFGSSLKSQRANSAFWGSLTLVLVFLLMRRYKGDAAGLTAMALLALSPYHLAYSQEMRSYAMATALAVLGFLMLERKNALGLFIVLTAELYTHYWGSFVVVAQLLTGYLYIDHAAWRKKIIICGVGALALFALWMPILHAQLYYARTLSFWVAPASSMNLIRTFGAYTGFYFHHASLAFQAPGPVALLWGLGILSLALAAWGARKGPKSAVVWLTVGLGIPFFLSYAINGIYVWYRYPILMYPAFLLLLVSGLKSMKTQWIRAALTGGLLLMASWSCYAYKTTWQKANPKAVVAYVQELNAPHTIVVRPDYFAALFAYYDGSHLPVVDQHTLSDPAQRAALQGKNIVLVAFDVPSDPIRDAFLDEFSVTTSRFFPGYAHLGITVYQLHAKS